MKVRFLLDTNVIVRFLAGDDAGSLAKAKQLFAAAEGGECELLLRPWIVAETVYVLNGVYQQDRAQVAGRLRRLVRAAGVVADEAEWIIDALSRFEKEKVDFADALLAAESAAIGARPASFDRDLDRFSDIKRFEPGQAIR